jgi:hypothetical protein
VLALAFTPVGSYAQGLLEVFRPQQFAVVPVSIADLEALPELEHYGEFSQVEIEMPRIRADAADASAAMGMSVLTPQYLPAAVSGSPTYITVPRQSATFTFSAAQAQAVAQVTMPANIDGTSVQMTTGNAVVAVYGGQALLDQLAGVPSGGQVAPPAHDGGPLSSVANQIPQLIVMKAEAPVATITGASAEDIREYLLSQPGISDRLADAVRAIGDPTKTWPIPVPVGEVNTRSVTVQGVRGTAFSDLSGFVAGVLWVKNGFIHAVGAPLSEGEVLNVANSLR